MILSKGPVNLQNILVRLFKQIKIKNFMDLYLYLLNTKFAVFRYPMIT